MKILIAEDDLTSRLMLKNLLVHWGFEVIAVDNGKQALEALSQPDAPMMALLDWMMPEMDGLEVCRQVRERENFQSIYIIILTSLSAKKDMIQGLNAGADDYVIKPYDNEELHARIDVGRRVVELQDKLLALSNTDALTGLGNRRRFFEVAKSEIYRSLRYYVPLSLILADLDGFKSINDSYGHNNGDRVLQEVAILLTKNLRETDILCRMGGDEFAMILPQTEINGAAILAERLRRAIEQHAFCLEDKNGERRNGKLTLSLGVGQFEVNDGSIDDLYKRADQLLYLAKSEGKNRTR